MISKTSKPDWIALALILSVAMALAYHHYKTIDEPFVERRMALHGQIVGGTAGSPYRYRALVPFALETLIKPAAIAVGYRRAFLSVYGLYDLGAIFLLLWALYAYFRLWYPRELSIIGVLFVAGTMPIALRDHYFQPWSLLEPAFFSLGMLVLHKKKHRLFGFIIMLASLNRETALFLVLAYVLTSDDLKNVLKERHACKSFLPLRPVIYFVLWLGTFVGLRLLLGYTEHKSTVLKLWPENLSAYALRTTFVQNILFLGIFWVFAVLGFRSAPLFVRRSALVAPFWLLAIILFALWWEVRLLMPLYAVFVPLGLSFVSKHALQEKGYR